MECAGNVSF